MPQVASGGRGRGVVAAAVMPSKWAAEALDDSGDEQQEGPLGDVQGRLFEKYMEACDELSGSEDEDRDAIFAQGLARVAEWVSAGASNSMCLICLGSIKPSEAIWHCGGSCFAVFHLPCMQDWARNQIDSASLRAHNANGSAPARDELEFGCPKCRFSYPAAQAPRSYTCFCGKQQDPDFDP
ncbi:nuclear transcription factor, X-box binding-like 1 [Monoraphidium neglectum]|uniref:Nuclear transcription factor, X-box binding-like 1 n=1 Tax=Monoraphidium neglectum TaxID=145388 RepID=A0A0D2LZF2_9CHLO|nr:nuclear transcription factor, X-box binding-like 1 [Monoraphidium neglectum]KIY94746.1 nuclear transcription factor, X-box binding-like 1 [Monoraphidium neglectum]|eukprot:XP_013893766.1 nuclear transcription factor, X-box binding-like 1 [Monoraphidium neglectum]